MLSLIGKLIAGELISATVRKLFNNNEEGRTMFEDKSLFASKTVWGGLIAIGASVAGFWGIDIAATEQAQLVQTITSIAGSIGGLIAIFGRIVAKKQIK